MLTNYHPTENPGTHDAFGLEEDLSQSNTYRLLCYSIDCTKLQTLEQPKRHPSKHKKRFRSHSIHAIQVRKSPPEKPTTSGKNKPHYHNANTDMSDGESHWPLLFINRMRDKKRTRNKSGTCVYNISKKKTNSCASC